MRNPLNHLPFSHQKRIRKLTDLLSAVEVDVALHVGHFG